MSAGSAQSGTATLRLKGEESDAVRALVQIDSRFKTLEQTMAKVAKQSAKGAEEASKGNRDWIESMARIAVVAGTVTRAYGMLRQEVEQTAKAGKTQIEQLHAAVAGAGDLANINEIQRSLRGMQGAGHLTMAERTGIYTSVRGEMPTADIKEVMPIVQLAAQATQAMGAQSGQLVASTMAEIRQLMPEAKPEDVADRAMMLVQAAGSHGKELQGDAFKGVGQLVAMGHTPDEAMGALLASMESDQGTRALTALASGGKKTPALRALLAQAKEKDYAGMLRGAAEGDYMQQQIALAMQSPDVRQALAMRQADASAGMVEFDQRGRAMEIEEGGKWLEGAMRRKGAGAIRRGYLRTAYDVSTTAGNDVEASMRLVGASDEDIKAFRLQRENPGMGMDEAYLQAVRELTAATRTLAEAQTSGARLSHASED